MKAHLRDECTSARCTICDGRAMKAHLRNAGYAMFAILRVCSQLAVGDAFERAMIDAPYASTYDTMLLE